MQATDYAITVAAAFGAFWALVLGAVVALRLHVERSPFRSRRGL
jgi:succinate-acetate transporter protein